MEDLTAKFDEANKGETAAAVLAVQHLMVKNGVCSFEELSTANQKAQDLISKLTSAIGEVGDNPDAMFTALREITLFIGGDSAIPSLNEAIEQMKTGLGKEHN
jgi:hypothetical protein